jgi:hypothetical protein
MRTIDHAAAAVNTMLGQLNRMRSDDQELQSSCKRVKLDMPEMSSFDMSANPSSSASVGSSYGNAAVAPIAIWWNLNASAPSPTRSSFDDMSDFVVRHSQIKPRSETLQDRCDAFCSALRLTDGNRVSLLILEGAEALWEDLTITGRWHSIQRCLASSGATCKLILITNRAVGTDIYTTPFVSDLLRIRVPGEPEAVPAPAPPVTAALINSAPQARFTSSLNARSASRVPKLSLHQQQNQQHQWHHYSSETSVSGSDAYPHGLSSPSSESDDFPSPTSEAQQQHHHLLQQHMSHHHMQQQHHQQQQQQSHQMPEAHMMHHDQLPQFEWDWAAAAPALPAQPLMFAPLQAPAHPTLYNIYDAFVASSYPPFDMFARPQAPLWFPGPPVMQ